MGNYELKKTIILANGEFPKKGGAAWKMLAEAKRVVCCDGAAEVYRRHFCRWPDIVIGDFDSANAKLAGGRWMVGNGYATNCQLPTTIFSPDQNTNDLEKAMAYCAKRGWCRPVIVGATGKREDHTLGNVFRALAYGCEIVTDLGRFVPICGRAEFKVRRGAAVSLFAPDPKTRMTSKGLAWPLDDVRFKNLYVATLNRATGARVMLTATKPVSVYIEG